MFDDRFDDSEQNEDKEQVTKPETDETEASDAPEQTDGEAENKPTDKGDDSSSISSDLIRGHINTIILRALYEHDKYGYEIIADIEKKSHGQYTLKQPTLYSALKRLENQGYIKAYWKTDEVSSGGRRKYFTLTEQGKQVTETNLAEWEYSRTIIDSLISDRSFDFNRPAPTPVDFTILRDSVSRVPVIKNDEADVQTVEGTQIPEQAQPVIEEDNEAAEQIIEQTEPVTEEANEDKEPVVEQLVIQEEPSVDDEAARLQAEQRRIAHENYLRLISTPVREEAPQQPAVDDIVPNSENINADSLLYNSKPETERDYKNLIDGIFNRAMYNGSVQTTYVRHQPQQQPRQEQRQSVQSAKITDKGRTDGITVKSSTEEVNSTYAVKTTYNKGLTLFKCAAVVLAITIIEFVFCLVYRNELAVSWIYPAVILLLGLIQFAVFGILLSKGYGQNCVRPTTNGYISTCLILTVIIVLIICSASFLMNMNAASISDIMRMIVIPSITALNISVFALLFKLFVK